MTRLRPRHKIGLEITSEPFLKPLADPDQRPSATDLAKLSDLDPEDSVDLTELWPDLLPSRRIAMISDLTDLAQDNVDLNFDIVYMGALQDEDGLVRAAALRGLSEYEGRDLIPKLATMLREDPETAVRRESAIL